MQRPERRKPRRRFSPPPLPRAPLDRHRTRRPPPRPRRPRLRQAPSFALTETTVKSEKEAGEKQPHHCPPAAGRQNPQGWATERRFSELGRGHPPDDKSRHGRHNAPCRLQSDVSAVTVLP